MIQEGPLPDLRDWKGLVLKAKIDFDSLKAGENDFVLFNLLCTLNHVVDWIVGDPLVSESTKKQARQLEDDDTELIKQLCNRVKHFKRARGSTAQVKRVGGFGTAPYGEGPFGVTYYVVEDRGKRIVIRELCSRVLNKWGRLTISE